MNELHDIKYISEFNRIMKDNDQLYRELSKRFGISESTFWITYILRLDEGRITQSEICDILNEPKQTVNSALKNMEAEGLITRTQGIDRRRRDISLTERGKMLAHNSVDLVILAEEHALESLSGDERKAMFALLKKYNEAFKQQLLTLETNDK